jgi:hypothetical protein
MAERENVARPAGPALAADSVAPQSRAEPELAMSYCPRCSERLAARSCKLICSSCGYYMSCSDFY